MRNRKMGNRKGRSRKGSKFRVLLMDWGGTLCDSNGTYSLIGPLIPPVLSQYGIKTTAAEYSLAAAQARFELRSKLRGSTARHSLGTHEKLIAKKLGHNISDSKAAALDRAIFSVYLQHCKPRRGAASFLKKAKEAGMHIFVISNSNREKLSAEIGALNFSQYFDGTICSQECGREKSRLLPFIHAMEASLRKKFATCLSDFLVIGNREDEDGQARRLGLATHILKEGEGFGRVSKLLF